MPYLKEDHAEVSYDESTDAVVGRLKEFAEGEPFREYMDELIEATMDTGSNKMLADTSQFDAAIGKEDQAWSVQNWAPRAEDAGLEHLAMVMPESVIAEMSVDKIVEMADDTINRGVFEDVEEAKSWLREQ